MTPELYLLLAYVLSGLTHIGVTILLDEKLQVRDVILSLLPVMNTMLATVGLCMVVCESGFSRKTIWRKK